MCIRDRRNLDAGLFNPVRADRVAVVLGGDLDLAGQQIFDRMIAAAVAELQLVSMQAISQRDHLVAQTDAEDRLLALELTDQINDLRHVFRIARPVGQEDADVYKRQDPCWR